MLLNFILCQLESYKQKHNPFLLPNDLFECHSNCKGVSWTNLFPGGQKSSPMNEHTT